jgi:transcriptional regulator with XRE-family HTH domain
VQNWESGRARPSPEYLRKFAELAPAFADEIALLIDSFEWHSKSETGKDFIVAPAQRESLLALSRELNIDIRRLFRDALNAGITSLSRQSSSDTAAVGRRAAIAGRSARERVRNKLDQHHQPKHKTG